MREDFAAAVRRAHSVQGAFITLGAPVLENECFPEPLVRIPLATLNRHGLIAGATGTGKTKTLQLLAEQIARAGVPVFVSDVKGDLAGLAAPGVPSDRIAQRAKETGTEWAPQACLMELLSLSGKLGATLRATVSSFGPVALAKVLGLNDTQTSVLALVFKYCDDRALPLLDFADLRAVLLHLTREGASELDAYGAVSKASVAVLLREMIELEGQGGGAFFGEPEFDLDDLLYVDAEGRGLVSILELSDVQAQPALFSTFMMWMLARLYAELPEVGDMAKPKLVFFFDEAHLLFRNASKAFVEQIEQVVRLVRSKGVSVFFVTQSPKDIPPAILGQLGHRIQHALRAFTEDDEKAMRAAARTFPKSDYYDIQSVLTTLGTGEALVTALSEGGAPTPPFICRMLPPTSRMGALTPAEIAQVMQTDRVREYAKAQDKWSAREILEQRLQQAQAGAGAQEGAEGDDDEAPPAAAAPKARTRKAAAPRAPGPLAPTRTPSSATDTIVDILNSPVARTVAGAVTRGLMGALLGAPARKRTTRRR